MRRWGWWVTACAAVTAVACSDAGGVDPDAIDSQELAAVRRALDSALADDTLYPTLAVLVFPHIDRASYLVTGTDTTRLVGIEFDIRVEQESGDSLIVDFTVVLGWRGYRTATRTVDSVYFILGAGRAPVDDALSTTFTPEIAGTGTGFVISESTDSVITVWLARDGHLRTTQSSYGSGRVLVPGVRLFRGSLSGEFSIAADELPDAASAVSSGKDFLSGARAMKLELRGQF